MLPNHGGDANGRLLGAAYDSATESRNRIIVDLGKQTAKTYDVNKGKAGTDQLVAFPGDGGVMDECQGFFTAVLPDDVSPFNTLFSVYDLSLSLSGPAHVATINATTLVATSHLAHNRAPGGASTYKSIIYLALRAFDGPSPQKLYKIHRYTAAVEELDWSLLGPSAANLSVGALHVGNTDDSLLVVACHESFAHDCSLYELSVSTAGINGTNGTRGRMVLPLPGLDPGPALGYCKSFDEARNMLYLGCTNITVVDLTAGREKVAAMIAVNFGTPSTGGSYSSGGIVVV